MRFLNTSGPMDEQDHYCIFDQVPKLARDLRTLFHKIQQGLQDMSEWTYASQESRLGLQGHFRYLFNMNPKIPSRSLVGITHGR